MNILFSPWFWLAFVLWTAGVGLIAGEHEKGAEHDRMQVAWDKANEVATKARQVRIDANRELMAGAQRNADKERQDHAKQVALLNDHLRDALGELRDRPARPGPGSQGKGGAPDAAGAGPSGGCTGAGLYRDDAEFLTWRADAAQRIRLQRDSCYRLYGAAREAVSKLQCQ